MSCYVVKCHMRFSLGAIGVFERMEDALESVRRTMIALEGDHRDVEAIVSDSPTQPYLYFVRTRGTEGPVLATISDYTLYKKRTAPAALATREY